MICQKNKIPENHPEIENNSSAVERSFNLYVGMYLNY
jgi:hypothetical protein